MRGWKKSCFDREKCYNKNNAEKTGFNILNEKIRIEGINMPLGWIDFSNTERSKILSVLELLSEKGTLDELGIAPIRDGFSNIFFPGTSTIQTRAKYFFVVPYALKDLERGKEVNPYKVLQTLDALEKETGRIFYEQNKNENGIIGKRAIAKGGWVKRSPADVYWAGLRKYGIFVGGNMSLSEYISAMCALKNQKGTLSKLGNRRDGEEDIDDRDAGDIGYRQFVKMPLYEENWMNNTHIQLTKREGEYLHNQIIATCQGTMMAYVLQHNMTEFLERKDFKDLRIIIEQFPEEIQINYWIALRFSEFLCVLRTIYNVVLSDEKNQEANETLEILWEDVQYYADIDVDDIFVRLELQNKSLYIFIQKAREYMKSEDIEGLKRLIKNREIELKGTGRARTCHPGEFDETEWFGGHGLDYRFSNAKVIIRDIFESEGIVDAESK